MSDDVNDELQMRYQCHVFITEKKISFNNNQNKSIESNVSETLQSKIHKHHF